MTLAVIHIKCVTIQIKNMYLIQNIHYYITEFHMSEKVN